MYTAQPGIELLPGASTMSLTGLRLTAVLSLPLAGLCQMTPRTAPIPRDPLEMVTGPIQLLDTPETQRSAVEALVRARSNESLKAAGLGYDLKLSFTVSSGGQTEYDGDWQMEEIYIPRQGTHWTAKSTAGYATTQIQVDNKYYGDAPGSTIPLRLHEARAALFGAIATPSTQASIRTSMATDNGVELTCYLHEASSIVLTATPGRRWDEAEDCIDPQTGLLQVHSVVPGRYYAYNYTNAPRLGDRVLPREVTVTEAGKVVSVIRVDSLTELATADANLFVPTAEMMAKGESIAMTGSVTLSLFPAGSAPGPDANIQPVCVFGVVSPAGQIVEAHSLQPSDPNSRAAVDFAKATHYSPSDPAGRPAQHFVFLIEKFAAAAKPDR